MGDSRKESWLACAFQGGKLGGEDFLARSFCLTFGDSFEEGSPKNEGGKGEGGTVRRGGCRIFKWKEGLRYLAR